MLQSIPVPTGSLDVRGPFGQDQRYAVAPCAVHPLVHEFRDGSLASARVIHTLPTNVAPPGTGARWSIIGACPSWLALASGSDPSSPAGCSARAGGSSGVGLADAW